MTENQNPLDFCKNILHNLFIAMKITIYTISDCQFCKAEKEYLQKHNLPFEEKNLEQNREWLTEMLAVSNNFAGTPVTKIEKDDGRIEVLKGFTQEEFDQVLGFKKEEPVTQASADVTIPPPSQPSPNQPTTPESQTQPPAQSSSFQQPNSLPAQPENAQPPDQPITQSAFSPSTQPPNPPPTQSTTPPAQTPPPVQSSSVNPPTSTQSNNPLASVLSDLEQKANPNSPSSPFSQPAANMPNIPDFNQ